MRFSSKTFRSRFCTATAMLILFTFGTTCPAEDQAASAADQGLLPAPDYSGDLWRRSHLTGDWGHRC